MMLLFLACTSPEQTGFASYDWVDEYETPEYLNDTLIQPYGMTAFQDGFLVMDRGASSLVYVKGENSEILAEEIVGSYFSEGETGLLLGGDQEIYTIDSDGNPSVWLDDVISPSAITQVGEDVFWIEEGDVWSFNGVERILIDADFRNPYDLIYWDGSLWIATQGDNAFWKYDLVNPPAKMVSLDDDPHRLAIGDEGLWITTRSSRWPYGGWIVFFDGENSEKITQTPPEPEWVSFYQDQVIWSSKQSITAYTEDSYEMLALQARVGSMFVQDGHLYWTDQQAGKLGFLALE